MKWLYEELDKKGCTLDRVGILLDVSMGIADEYKEHAMVGSGLVLCSEEWVALGQGSAADDSFWRQHDRLSAQS